MNSIDSDRAAGQSEVAPIEAHFEGLALDRVRDLINQRSPEPLDEVIGLNFQMKLSLALTEVRGRSDKFLTTTRQGTDKLVGPRSRPDPSSLRLGRDRHTMSVPAASQPFRYRTVLNTSTRPMPVQASSAVTMAVYGPGGRSATMTASRASLG